MNSQASRPTMTPTARTSTGGIVYASFGAIMMALATGALWLLLCLALPGLHTELWLALPLALLLGVLVRRWIIDAPQPAAVLAALAMLLACAYMRTLLMASELAASFGMDFMQALHNAGVGMLLHLAWLSAGPAALTAYLTAAILAGIVARMSRRHI